MNKLIEFGCDEAQGYLFSRPQPGHDLTEWFAASTFGLAREPDLRAATRRRVLAAA